MGEAASLLHNLDHICAQFAAALHASELHIYTVLTLLIMLGVLYSRRRRTIPTRSDDASGETRRVSYAAPRSDYPGNRGACS